MPSWVDIEEPSLDSTTVFTAGGTTILPVPPMNTKLREFIPPPSYLQPLKGQPFPSAGETWWPI